MGQLGGKGYTKIFAANHLKKKENLYQLLLLSPLEEKTPP